MQLLTLNAALSGAFFPALVTSVVHIHIKAVNEMPTKQIKH